MILPKEELLDSIKSRIGEDVSDDALALIENVSDTLNDMETRVNEAGDWKAKYEQNDKEWREKYRDRFFNNSNEEYQKEDEKEYEETETPMTFEELFSIQ